MIRMLLGWLFVAAAVVPGWCSDPLPPTAVADTPSLSGLWFGSWGGGPQPGGVIFQPVIAEMLVKQEHIEIVGFPNGVSLVGTFRVDADGKTVHLLEAAKPGAAEKPRKLDYTFQLKGDTLTLTDADKRSVVLDRQRVSQKPPANLAVELVAVEEINEAGNLIINEFIKLRAGSVAATYYQTETRALRTKGATVLLVDESSCKKISLADARPRIKHSATVALTYRPDARPQPNQLHTLWTEIGQPAADDDAGMQTLARTLRPGTLVFVLPAAESVPVP